MAIVPSNALDNPVRAGISGNLVKTKPAVIIAPGGGLPIGTQLRFHRLPAHCEIHNVTLYFSAANASLTGKVGYTATDGDAGSSDDDALIVASTAMATAAKFSANAVATPVPHLPKESFIDLVTAGAAIAAATVVTCVVEYVYDGVP